MNLENEEAEELPYEKAGPAKEIELDEGEGLREARFVDPVSVIVSVGAAVLAELIVDRWLRSKEQGAMVDLRQSPPIVSRVAGVPAGVLLIINADETKDVRQFDYDKRSGMKDAIAAVLQAAAGGA